MWESMFDLMSGAMTATLQVQQANLRAASRSMELAANSVILTTLLFGSRVLDIKISFSKDNLLDNKTFNLDKL